MLSTLIGLLLVLLGIVCYIIALVVYVKTTIKAPSVSKSPVATINLQELLDAVTKVLEQFAKLTAPVQWALLGSLNIGIGLYLLAHKVF